MKSLLILGCFMGVVALHAEDRASTDYVVQSDEVNAGGGASVSADYSHHGALGALPAVTQSADYGNRAGHVARIYEVTGRTLEMDPAEVNEDASKLAAVRDTLDDDTQLVVPAGDYIWTVVSGPASVNGSGNVSGQSVWQDSAAVIKASGDSELYTLNFTVKDTLPDNFGTYAADGLPDAWQEQYFGLNNPDAAPTADPDGDQQDNAFEHEAGVNPVDRMSLFSLRIQKDPKSSGLMQLVFTPRFEDRNYVVFSSQSLGDAAGWQTLPAEAVLVDDQGLTRVVTDLIEPEDTRFYRVVITPKETGMD